MTTHDITKGVPLERLAEICEAERDGRCVVLPCKVGDTVYAIVHCDEIMKDYDDDYVAGTGEITCPFEGSCQFEECDDSNRRVVETCISGFSPYEAFQYLEVLAVQAGEVKQDGQS